MTTDIGAQGGRSDPARSGLGPHVVGTRVVVRRVLPGETGPSGGPAMTDVLGICLAWADGSCVVQPEAGPPVTIAVGDIVSGKPVPPRPSPRLRVDPAGAQRRSLALWPDLVTEPMGDWVLRCSDGSDARRANSVLAVGEPDAADPVAAVARWYAARGRRPIAAVLADGPHAGLFLGAGWVPESGDADTLFLLGGVSAGRRRAPSPDPSAEVTVEDGVATASLAGGVAVGHAAYADGWVGMRGIAVDPAYRRRGLGLGVMAVLLEWAAEQGAETAYLQVLGDNEPALALYERLGFVVHHAYRYLAEPLRTT